jgi:hypothetical protein
MAVVTEDLVLDRVLSALEGRFRGGGSDFGGARCRKGLERLKILDHSEQSGQYPA